ncbi:hypothetical protein RCCGEPOP_28534, partial [Rhizobium sp. Pop5]
MLVDQEYIQWSLWGAAAFSSFVSLLVVIVVTSRLSRLAGKLDADPAAAKLSALEMAQERIERNVRDDLRAARE